MFARSHIPRSVSNASKSFATFSAAAHGLASSSKNPPSSPKLQCTSSPRRVTARNPPLSSASSCDSRRGFASTPRSSGNSLESVSSKPSWDHIFADLDDKPPLLSSPVRNKHSRGNSEYGGRRHTMTAREIRAFDEMFDMIFDSASNSSAKVGSSMGSSSSDVGIGKDGVNDLFGKLRRNSRRMKWTTENDHVLDRKKEAIDLCDTDQQLLDWAVEEVFAESERYEQAARHALLTASETGATQELPGLQPPAYSQLVSLLMRTFRDKYHDPHLALSIFDHAKHLSIASYVFGCSTHAYNELLETRWSCFRDLNGVHSALQEMKVNAVAVDTGTRRIVDNIRREIGEENLWVDDNESGSSEVWNLLTKIDELVARRVKKSTKPLKWEDWKARSLSADEGEDWEFGNWSAPTKIPARIPSRRTGGNRTFGLRQPLS